MEDLSLDQKCLIIQGLINLASSVKEVRFSDPFWYTEQDKNYYESVKELEIKLRKEFRLT